MFKIKQIMSFAVILSAALFVSFISATNSFAADFPCPTVVVIAKESKNSYFQIVAKGSKCRSAAESLALAAVIVTGVQS